MRKNLDNSGLSYASKPAQVRLAHAGLAISLCALGLTLGCKETSFFTRKHYSKPSIDSATAALAAIRESGDPALRRAAFQYLGDPSHLSSPGDRDEVSSVLALAYAGERQAETRIVILRSLAQLGSAKRWEAFNTALKDGDAAVRATACRLIGSSGSMEQTKALDELLVADTNLDVRLAAADALGNIPTRDAALALLSGVEDTDVAVRYRCRQSLQHMTGKDLGGSAAAWRETIQTANFEELATHRKSMFAW